MPVKKAIKSPNITASIYNGELQILFDCVGAEVCRFALCPVMPPDGSEECTYRDHGSCINPPAQYAAITRLRSRLLKELNERSEEF